MLLRILTIALYAAFASAEGTGASCHPSDCLHGGTCPKPHAPLYNSTEWVCDCPHGYKGHRCGHAAVHADLSEPHGTGADCTAGMCLNGGTCPSIDHPLYDTANWKCHCAHGFAGPRCSAPVEYCSDDHMCLNGGTCVAHKANEGHHGGKTHWICECGDANHHSKAWAGHMCEHEATDFCHKGGKEASKVGRTFCTNHGVCKEMVENNEEHLGCNCNDDWEGDHCEYAQGTLPEFVDTTIVGSPSKSGASLTATTSNQSNPPLFLIASVAIAALLVGALVGMMVQYRRKANRTDPAISSGAELVLDADGSGTMNTKDKEVVDENVTPTSSEEEGEII